MAINVDAMFSFILVAGFTALLMFWETLVLALKGCAVQREATRNGKVAAPSGFA